MNAPVLALFERSLRLETRSVLMFLARLAVPGVLLLTMVVLAIQSQFGIFSAPGRQFFAAIVWVNFWFITLAGLGYFASAITEEKEEMMLGLLRMTGLTPLALLLGKSTCRLVGAGLMLLTQVPFALLAYTLGGVSRLQIAAAVCTLGAYLFLLCNLATLWSVVFRRTIHAATVTGILIVALFSLPTALLAGMQELALDYRELVKSAWWEPCRAVLGWLRDASPLNAISEISQTGFAGSVLSWQVWSNLAGGAACFLLAWAVFERFTREQKEDAPTRVVIFRRRLRFSRVPERITGGRAITWKDFQFLYGGKRGAWLKFGVVGLLIAIIVTAIAANEKNTNVRQAAAGTMMIVAMVAGGIGLIVDASRMFRLEVRWKTLSGLMLLPVSAREVACRKVLAALLGLIPLAAWFVIGAVLGVDLVGEALGGLFESPEPVLMLGVAVLQFIFFLHLVALMSLLVKRGGLPLAFAAYYFGGSFGSILFVLPLMIHGPRSTEIFIFIAGGVSLGLIALLQWAIGARLVRLAHQE